MHYYKFNIPTWNLHTAHLTLVEDAIYRRLVDHYYDTEAPIPVETQSVFRRLRMASESDTASRILEEFFYLTEDGWRHKTCDEVIRDYHGKADKNRRNGSSGGRPSKSALTDNREKTQSVSSGGPEVTLTNNYKLLTTNQDIKQANACSSAEPDDDVAETSEDGVPDCPHLEIVGLYNQILASNGLAAVKPNLWNGRRATHLRRRWREDPKRQDLDWWRKFFEFVSRSDFLMGRKTDFAADLGWLVQHGNFVKVCEGKYRNA